MIIDLSAKPIKGAWQELQNRRTIPLVDYEAGGPILDQPTGERFTHMWEATSDGTSVWVARQDLREEKTLILTDTGITQIAIAFDQPMRCHVAYVAGGVVKFYYYDTLSAAFQTMVIPDAVTPRLCSDEKRDRFEGQEDVILAYMRGPALIARYQRERYLTEHTLQADTNGVSLTTIGMNNANRLQWKIKPKPGWSPPKE